MFFLLTGSLLQEEVKPWVEDIKEQNRCSASALLILKEDEMVFSRICTLGNLHLRRGNINGQQIVPKEVIEIATQVQSPEYKSEETPLNGAFWYVQGTPSLKSEIGDRVPKGAFQIIGVTGPTLLVIPEYNVVVAKMYNKRYNYEGIDGKDYLYYLREFSNLVADTFSK